MVENEGFLKGLKMKTSELSKSVDRLGRVAARIAKLEAIEAKLKSNLIESGQDEIDGELFRVQVLRFEKGTTAWKAIAEKLEASPQMIAGNTKTSEVVSVRLGALV